MKLNESGSVAMMLWIPCTLGLGLFLWIACGKIFDILLMEQFRFAAANPNLPVSADRIYYSGLMATGFSALLIFGILLPVIFYSIKQAKLRTNSEI